jgi:hypothetical protein
MFDSDNGNAVSSCSGKDSREVLVSQYND